MRSAVSRECACCLFRSLGASIPSNAEPAMNAAELEALLRYVALPPLKLGLRERYLRLPRLDSAAAAVVAGELSAVERRRARLTRQGWWN